MELVREPGKSSGAIGFACLFLCFFLLGKQKKEEKEWYCQKLKDSAKFTTFIQT